MKFLFSNNATATLASSITAAATTLPLSSGLGSRFPSPVGTDVFHATLADASGNIEIVRVTARATDTLTVVRGQEGTAARNFAAGDRVELRLTAAALNSLANADAVQEANAQLQGEIDAKQDKAGTFPYAQLTGVPPAPPRYSTGEWVLSISTTAPAGTLVPDGSTIGSAASGATGRANADTAALFAALWGATTNTDYPIQDSAGAASTRGASAEADFAANKRLPLPNIQDGDALIAAVSSSVLTRSVGANLSHTHTVTVDSSGAHTHSMLVNPTSGSGTNGGGVFIGNADIGLQSGSAGAHTHTASADASGGAKNLAAGLFVRVYLAL